MQRFSREKLLIGEENFNKLAASKVVVVGLGGVGGYAVEAVARAGVNNIVIVDGDVVEETNINRQIFALTSTVGKRKTQAAYERIMDINPEANVAVVDKFIFKDDFDAIFSNDVDYVIDAIDMVSVKLDLICYCKEKGISIISSMGTGNKLNASMFKVADIFETNNDGLARVIRRELRKRNVTSLKVVFSEEKAEETNVICDNGARKPGSISFVPPMSGLLMAAEVINDILNG